MSCINVYEIISCCSAVLRLLTILHLLFHSFCLVLSLSLQLPEHLLTVPCLLSVTVYVQGSILRAYCVAIFSLHICQLHINVSRCCKQQMQLQS